jgi:hypothetical protein
MPLLGSSKNGRHRQHPIEAYAGFPDRSDPPRPCYGTWDMSMRAFPGRSFASTRFLPFRRPLWRFILLRGSALSLHESASALLSRQGAVADGKRYGRGAAAATSRAHAMPGFTILQLASGWSLKSNATLAFHAGLLNRFHLHEGQREILRLLPVAYSRRCGPHENIRWRCLVLSLPAQARFNPPLVGVLGEQN